MDILYGKKEVSSLMSSLKWIIGLRPPKVGAISGIDLYAIFRPNEFNNDNITSFISTFTSHPAKFMRGRYLGYTVFACENSEFIFGNRGFAQQQITFDYQFYVLTLGMKLFRKWKLFQKSDFYHQLPSDMKKLLFEFFYQDLIKIRLYQLNPSNWFEITEYFDKITSDDQIDVAKLTKLFDIRTTILASWQYRDKRAIYPWDNLPPYHPMPNVVYQFI